MMKKPEVDNALHCGQRRFTFGFFLQTGMYFMKPVTKKVIYALLALAGLTAVWWLLRLKIIIFD